MKIFNKLILIIIISIFTINNVNANNNNNNVNKDIILRGKDCILLYQYQRFFEYTRDNDIDKNYLIKKINEDKEINYKIFLIDEVNFIYALPKKSKQSKSTLKQCNSTFGLILRKT